MIDEVAYMSAAAEEIDSTLIHGKALFLLRTYSPVGDFITIPSFIFNHRKYDVVQGNCIFLSLSPLYLSFDW